MTAVECRRGPAWSRNAGVLVWTLPLLLGPVLDLHGTPGSVTFQVALVVVIAASAVTVDDDMHATASLRRRIVAALVERVVAKAVTRALTRMSP